MKTIVEFIWLQSNSISNYYSKIRIMDEMVEIPDITDHLGNLLIPVYSTKSPFWENGILVYCRHDKPDRNKFEYEDQIGVTQNYKLYHKDNEFKDRNISDQHLKMCLDAGINITEMTETSYAIGFQAGITSIYHHIIANFILLRIVRKISCYHYVRFQDYNLLYSGTSSTSSTDMVKYLQDLKENHLKHYPNFPKSEKYLSLVSDPVTHQKFIADSRSSIEDDIFKIVGMLLEASTSYSNTSPNYRITIV
jgi:hypothetical protein